MLRRRTATTTRAATAIAHRPSQWRLRIVHTRGWKDRGVPPSEDQHHHRDSCHGYTHHVKQKYNPPKPTGQRIPPGDTPVTTRRNMLWILKVPFPARPTLYDPIGRRSGRGQQRPARYENGHSQPLRIGCRFVYAGRHPTVQRKRFSSRTTWSRANPAEPLATPPRARHRHRIDAETPFPYPAEARPAS